MDSASTASQDNAPFKDESANSLETDMTDEELIAFVDKTLGAEPTVANAFGNSKALPTVNEIAAGKEDKAEDKPATEEKPVEEDKKEEPAKPTEPPKDEEEQKPADIPDVDTSDLWIEFEGVGADAEGKPVAKTFKVSVNEELPPDVRFKDDKQLFEVMDAMREMRDTLEQREAEHDKLVTEADQQTATQTDQQELQNSWNSEISDLIQAGLLEQPKAQAKDAAKGYTPEEVEADPALKRIDDVFKFMTEENTKRRTDGKTLLRSFGTAFNLYQKQERAGDEAKKAEEEKAKDAEIKRRGSMVGGGSGASASGKPYVYAHGSAKSIYDVDTSDL